MKFTKKLASLLLAIVMLFSITAGIEFSAYAGGGGPEIFTSGNYEYYYEDEDSGSSNIIIIDYNGSESKLTIPSKLAGKNVVGIEFYFSENEKITSISIPSFITFVYGSFSAFPNLTSVTVDKNNTVYDSRDNCNAIIETRTNTLLAGCKNTKIPNTVTSIAGSAFYGCTGLTSINIPNSVTSIQWEAFASCNNLSKITIPDSITQIGEWAFDDTAYYYNSNNWNNGVLYIGNHLVATNEEKVSGKCTIKSGTITIADYAFAYCDGLTSVTVPNSVKSIGEAAFAACNNLSQITIPDSVTHIGEFVLEDTAYYDNAKNWNNGVLYIGNHLISANDEKVSGKYAIKNGTITIADRGFAWCYDLTGVTIPNTVKTIGNSAFIGCNLSSITVPSSVTKIGSAAFCYNNNLSSIAIDKNNKAYDSRDNSNAIIETKSNALLAGCKNTKIPNTVKSISDFAFYGCAPANVTIPSSVTHIGNEAFDECENLKSITIQNKNAYIDGMICYDKVTIYGYKGSTAETYAKKFGNKFVALSEAAKLSAPTLKVTVNSNGTFNMTWNKITGAEKYEIYYKQTDGSYKLLKTVTGTSYTSGFAQYGKQYSYKMKAVKGNTKSDYSKVVNATNNKKLQTPTLKVSVNSNGTFKMTWNKVTGATSYQIYYKQADGSYKLLKTVTGTSYTSGFAQYGKQYSYKMKAVTSKNSSATSNYSSVVNATNNKKLQTPTLKVTVNSNGTFKMTWNKVTGATSYQIYYKQADGSYKLLKTVTGTSYTSGFAQYGKQYSYKMRAVTSKNSSATSNYSSVVNAKNTKKLGTPTLKAAVNKNGSFKLSWGKVTGATSYQIYWKQANGSYKLLKTVSGTSYTTVVAAKGKTYSYKVRAVTKNNKNATSNYSNVVNAKRK